MTASPIGSGNGGLDPEFWDSRFRERRTPWERDELNPAFLAWRAAGLLPRCRILVPGAGRSREPLAMLQAGFDVVALDLAQSAVTTQRELIGEGRVVQADATVWMPDQPFDAVYDQTCLCALPPDLWVAYERQLRSWIRPGGCLFVLFMQTGRNGGPPFDCSLSHMQTLFHQWVWPDTLPDRISHPLGGFEQPAVLIRPKGPAEPSLDDP